MRARMIFPLVWVFLLNYVESALLHGVDSSGSVSQVNYETAKQEGFEKVVIRGYSEACESGGLVDPNFVSSYIKARAAGLTNIDIYWFPCSGASNRCKSYATRLQELRATMTANKMNITTLWVDIENDPTFCHNWNYGTSGNLAEAR
ncbi:MAG: hypothetical protein BYD32DRAFT_28306 [Podila humilis]|nr:MAG: hypothetical protein BYD32DRAFT_28306 [Podila humilis]